ncbi:alpha-ketoglutarate-dependent dioxygenase AlkB [Halomonas sp. 22501_18_FS]|uniref:Alpha-ketoglutarate-dependent dioxygenase AlkB n=1 Tax=Vreelandella halophila TaxID=86177 RepID=A0A9X4YAU7_9GAMM|nr:alpha-ketoglutarate-dependent dioxygenase AlkB [Halomonas utahensis]MYL73698.1 alpha-ketoglutarate-dependent dioxygenase AlkB [Halomonas sp. 22501_18_FS]
MPVYELPPFQLPFHHPFLAPEEADELLALLLERIPWKQDRITLFGREHLIPREQCWIAEDGLNYRYSGQTLEPAQWPDWLRPLARQVGDIAGEHFNSVLANRYRDGSDSMGWHSDDEPELGPSPVIASLSLGGTRRFRFRHREDHGRTLSIDLPHNSLLVMPAGVQSHWHHALPKTRKPVSPRINLTFRRLVDA